MNSCVPKVVTAALWLFDRNQQERLYDLAYGLIEHSGESTRVNLEFITA